MAAIYAGQHLEESITSRSRDSSTYEQLYLSEPSITQSYFKSLYL